MATFDDRSGTAQSASKAMEMGTGIVPLDGSFEREYMNQQGPTVPPSVGKLGVSAYNGGEVVFQCYPPNSDRTILARSYIRITGVAYADYGAGVKGPVPTNTSIPWNPIAALMEGASIQYNFSGPVAEQFEREIGHGSNMKFLTTYSKEALESMSDSLFTPTVESTRDVVGTALIPYGTDGPAAAGNIEYISGLSPESQERSARWLYSKIPPYGDLRAGEDGPWGGSHLPPRFPKVHTKDIMLGDLFDSARLPAALNLNRFEIKLKIKRSEDILFHDPYLDEYLGQEYESNIAAPSYYFVTKMDLYVCHLQLSLAAIDVEVGRVLNQPVVFRQSFKIYGAERKICSADPVYQHPGLKSLQAAMALFPSTTCGDVALALANDGTHTREVKRGINPFQYCYNFGAGPAGSGRSDPTARITSIQFFYAGRISPNQPMLTGTLVPLRGSNALTYRFHYPNAEVLSAYRAVSGMTGVRDHSAAVGMQQLSGGWTSRAAWVTSNRLWPAAEHPYALKYQTHLDGCGVVDEDETTDNSSYAILSGNPFPVVDAYPHLSMYGGILEIRMTGGSPISDGDPLRGPAEMVAVVVRLGLMSIMGDGSVQIINS